MLIEYTKNGRQRMVSAKLAKILVGKGLAREVVEAAPIYQTRMMQAAPVAPAAEPAPYGYKADGTPRKRPGRPAVVKASEEE